MKNIVARHIIWYVTKYIVEKVRSESLSIGRVHVSIRLLDVHGTTQNNNFTIRSPIFSEGINLQVKAFKSII